MSIEQYVEMLKHEEPTELEGMLYWFYTEDGDIFFKEPKDFEKEPENYSAITINGFFVDFN